MKTEQNISLSTIKGTYDFQWQHSIITQTNHSHISRWKISIITKKKRKKSPQGTGQKLYLTWKLCDSIALKNGVILVRSTLWPHGARDCRDPGGTPYDQRVYVAPYYPWLPTIFALRTPPGEFAGKCFGRLWKTLGDFFWWETRAEFWELFGNFLE